MSANLWFNAITNGDLSYVEHNAVQCAGMRNDAGDTALIVAARMNNLPLVKCLMNHESGLINSLGETAFSVAAREGHKSIVQALAPLESHVFLANGNTCLIRAAELGDTDMVQCLIQYSTQWHDRRGASALVYAVAAKQYEAVRLMLRLMPISRETIDGALEVAVGNTDQEMVSILQASRASMGSLGSSTFGLATAIYSPITGSAKAQNEAQFRLSPDPVTRSRNNVDTIPATQLSEGYHRKLLTKHSIKEHKLIPTAAESTHTLPPPTRALVIQANEAREDFLTHSAAIASYHEALNQGSNNTLSASTLGTSEDLKRSGQTSLLATQQTLSNRATENAMDAVIGTRLLVNTLLDKISGAQPVEHVNSLDDYVAREAGKPTLHAAVASQLTEAKSLLAAAETSLRASLNIENQARRKLHEAEELQVTAQANVDAMYESVARSLQNSLAQSTPIIGMKKSPSDERDIRVEPPPEEDYDYDFNEGFQQGPSSNKLSGLYDSHQDKCQERETPCGTVEQVMEQSIRVSELPEVYPEKAARPYPALPRPTTKDWEGADTDELALTDASTDERRDEDRSLADNQAYMQDEVLRLPPDPTSPAPQPDFSGMGASLRSMIASGAFKTEECIMQKGIQSDTPTDHPNYLGNYKYQRQIVNVSTGRFTELMSAVRRNDLIAVRALVPHQAGLADESGVTALMMAAESGFYDCATLLLQWEARHQDRYGETALMKAARSNRARLCELLVSQEAGQRTNDLCPDGDDLTALCLACKVGAVECVRVLLPHEGQLSYGFVSSPAYLSSSADIKSLVTLFSL